MLPLPALLAALSADQIPILFTPGLTILRMALAHWVGVPGVFTPRKEPFIHGCLGLMLALRPHPKGYVASYRPQLPSSVSPKWKGVAAPARQALSHWFSLGSASCGLAPLPPSSPHCTWSQPFPTLLPAHRAGRGASTSTSSRQPSRVDQNTV